MYDLYVVAPLSSMSKRTRLFKLLKNISNNRRFSKVHHIGWERILGESEEHNFENLTIEKNIIMRGGGYGGVVARIKYLAWMIKVFFVALAMPKFSTVWALGFESAFPLVLASVFKKHNVYFDDADRFLLLFKWPRFVYLIIRYLEVFTSRKSLFHIVPNVARYDYESKSFFELKNLPSSCSIEKSKDLVAGLPDLKRYKVVINANGWLGKNRGMDTLQRMLAQLDTGDVAVLLAGKIDCEGARKLSEMEHCYYLGEVTNEEALATYYISDFVFTYYDTKYPINRFAESNKWGDAIYTNTAILVNREVETARFLFEKGVVKSLTYSDEKEIINFINKCISNPSVLMEQKACVGSLLGQYMDFDISVDMLFKRLLCVN